MSRHASVTALIRSGSPTITTGYGAAGSGGIAEHSPKRLGSRAINEADHMTSNAAGGRRILGSLRSADGKGLLRMEDRFDTDIDDVWSALTDPLRLVRWYGEVEGDLRLGGEFRARLFASGW